MFGCFSLIFPAKVSVKNVFSPAFFFLQLLAGPWLSFQLVGLRVSKILGVFGIATLLYKLSYNLRPFLFLCVMFAFRVTQD